MAAKHRQLTSPSLFLLIALAAILLAEHADAFDTRWVACVQGGPHGKDYRGFVNQTVSGRRCQAWSQQFPHVHHVTPALFPAAGLDENYCRNPDGEVGVWCFTTDPGVPWEYCDVCPNKQHQQKQRPLAAKPSAAAAAARTPSHHKRTTAASSAVDMSRLQRCFSASDRGQSYRGSVNRTVSGRLCQAWDAQNPHAHSHTATNHPTADLAGHNFCRNPDGDAAPWCFTTDPAVEHEFCDVCGSQLPPQQQQEAVVGDPLLRPSDLEMRLIRRDIASSTAATPTPVPTVDFTTDSTLGKARLSSC
jgi:hypothetical protein